MPDKMRSKEEIMKDTINTANPVAYHLKLVLEVLIDIRDKGIGSYPTYRQDRNNADQSKIYGRG